MSDTTNAFDNPGGNFPDRDESAKTTADPAAHRSDAGVGGEVVDESSPSSGSGSTEATQDEPALDQNQRSTQDQLDGIAMQTRADLGDESQDRYEEVLRQRLRDAGIQLTDEDVRALADRSSPGGAGGGGV
jgi:uncharacterized caspase-like protein